MCQPPLLAQEQKQKRIVEEVLSTLEYEAVLRVCDAALPRLGLHRQYGNSPILIASLRGHMPIVQWLVVEKRVDVANDRNLVGPATHTHTHTVPVWLVTLVSCRLCHTMRTLFGASSVCAGVVVEGVAATPEQ